MLPTSGNFSAINCSSAERVSTFYDTVASTASYCDCYLMEKLFCTIMGLLGNRSFTLTIGNNKRNRLRGLKNGVPKGSVY